MADKFEIKERFINGKKLVCPICNNNTFWSKRTLMNTPGMTFFRLDWANKSAQNYICGECGYVNWFLNK